MSAPPSDQDALFPILITLLVPLFLGGATGNTDPALARAAATQALQGFSPANTWEALTALRIVGFSMGAAASLAAAADDTVPPAAAMRWRSNAGALQRSADRGQDRLDACRGIPGRPRAAPRRGGAGASAAVLPSLDDAAIAEAMRQVAELNVRVAEARDRLRAELPAIDGPPPEPAPQAAMPEAATPEAAPAAPARLTPPPQQSRAAKPRWRRKGLRQRQGLKQGPGRRLRRHPRRALHPGPRRNPHRRPYQKPRRTGGNGSIRSCLPKGSQRSPRSLRRSSLSCRRRSSASTGCESGR
jgi:hypothetical protein